MEGITAETLKQDEAVPTYPATPTGLSTAAAAINASVIWSRIEAYVWTRWTSRAVVWTVEGPGEWMAVASIAVPFGCCIFATCTGGSGSSDIGSGSSGGQAATE